MIPWTNYIRDFNKVILVTREVELNNSINLDFEFDRY